MSKNELISVLIVDDDEKGARLLAKGLFVSSGIRADCVFSGEEALKVFRKGNYDAFLIDLNMPGMDGIETLKVIREARPFCPIMIITGHNEIQTAVKSIKEGAYDYLVKPFDIDHVANVVIRACEQMNAEKRDEANRITRNGAGTDTLIFSEDSSLALVAKTVEKVACSDASVMIIGPSGTGKELIAQRIHRKSQRSNNPFIVLNCGAIPQELFESELFGHEKGAFTGAIEKRVGLFALADNGTLFLDEIAEMPLSMQVKLLRTLQSGEVRMIGGNNILYVNTRVICATAKNLLEEVKAGRFREDLFYRLNVINLVIPPLNERKQDIPLLVDYFLKNIRIGGRMIPLIDLKALEALQSYDWPGNVRELKNAVERLMLLCSGEVIRREDVERNLKIAPSVSKALEPEKEVTLEELEEYQIRKVLSSTGGNKMQAAKRLGITVQTLYNKLNKISEKERQSGEK